MRRAIISNSTSPTRLPMSALGRRRARQRSGRSQFLKLNYFPHHWLYLHTLNVSFSLASKGLWRTTFELSHYVSRSHLVIVISPRTVECGPLHVLPLFICLAPCHLWSRDGTVSDQLKLWRRGGEQQNPPSSPSDVKITDSRRGEFPKVLSSPSVNLVPTPCILISKFLPIVDPGA